MGKGSIQDRSGPTGAAWKIRWYVGVDPDTGRSRYRSKTIRGPRRSAERELNRLLRDLDGARNTVDADRPFSWLLNRWITHRTARWSPKTLKETKGFVARWIAPAEPDQDEPEAVERWRHSPGRTPIGQLTTPQLDDWITWLGTQLKPSSVRRIRGVARAALEQGVRWEIIARNPAAHTDPIEGQPAEVTPPTAKALATFLAAVEADHPQLALIVRLAAITGRRRGELCALRWTDLDLDGVPPTVTPTRVLSEGEQGWVERPISKNNRRSTPIALDARTVDMLHAHQAATATDLATVDLELPGDGHVFTRLGKYHLEPWTPNAVTMTFQRVRSENGLDGVNFHHLRHYVATTLLAGGTSATNVAGRLGHGDGGRTTLNVYAHSLPAVDQAAAEALAAALDDQEAS